MFYVVCYDIENNKRRNHISRILGNFGQRVQKSVFECELDERTYEQMLRQLSKEFTGDDQDSIRIYPLCQECKKKAMGIGKQLGSDTMEKFIFL